MEPVPDVTWSEVLRAAIRVRLEAEEDLRKDLDPRRALRAAKGMDAIRARMSGRWGGSKGVRGWRRRVGYVEIEVEGRKAPVPGAFADDGERPLLGATALEILGFSVDPQKRRLVPAPALDV